MQRHLERMNSARRLEKEREEVFRSGDKWKGKPTELKPFKVVCVHPWAPSTPLGLMRAVIHRGCGVHRLLSTPSFPQAPPRLLNGVDLLSMGFLLNLSRVPPHPVASCLWHHQVKSLSLLSF